MKVWPFTRNAPRADMRALAYEDFHGRALDASRAPITPDAAAGLSPVFAAVRVVSETISSLPIHVVEKTGDTRERVDHPVADLLSEPNGAMAGCTFWETLISCHELRGNSYAEIVRDRTGRPVALWPLKAGTVRPERRGASVIYHVSTRDGVVEADASRILHLRFGVLSADGITGCDPVSLLRADLAAARATRDAALNYMQNGLQPSGVLSHPASLSEQAAQRLRDSWQKYHGGAKNAGKALILEDGLSWTAMGTDAEKSQLLASRQFSVSDVARIWLLPPHKLADLSRSSFSNIESEELSFVKNSIRPRVRRIEAELNRALFTPDERRRLSVQFEIDGLMRGATLQRYQSHAIALANGWMNRNEVRKLEDLPAVDGLETFVEGLPGATVATGATQPAGDGQNEEQAA